MKKEEAAIVVLVLIGAALLGLWACLMCPSLWR